MRSFARQLCVTAFLLSGTVLAQVPAHAVCVDRTGTMDALVSANQSRSVERELQQLRQLYHWDRVRLREVVELRGEEHWTANGLLAVAGTSFAGFPLCYSGDVQRAELSTAWLTLMASVENHRRELGFRLFMFLPQTKLAHPDASEEDYPGPSAYAIYNQPLFALEAQLTRYFSVMGGWLTPRSLRVEPGLRAPPLEKAEGRPLLHVGVPAANLYTSLILSPGASALETMYLDLRRLPLGQTPFELSARAGYLSNEERIFTSLGASYALPLMAKQWEPRLEAEAATEYGAFRLRQAELGASVGIPSIAFSNPEMYGQVEFYARLSLFNSAWLQQQTAASGVPGGTVGARLAFGGDVAMLLFEPFAAYNAPELLSLFSEGVDRLSWGGTFALRVSPWFF